MVIRGRITARLLHNFTDRNYAQSKTSDSDFRLESESREYTCTPAVCLQTNSAYSRRISTIPGTPSILIFFKLLKKS